MSNRGRYGKYGELKRLERLKGREFKRIPIDQKGPSFYLPERKRSSIAFRRAGQSDKEFVRGLSEELFSVYGDYGDFLAGYIDKEKALAWIIDKGDEKIGFAIASPTQDGDLTRYEIIAIGLLPRFQGKGIGKRFLDFVLLSLRKIGVMEVFIHTGANNKRAQGLFLKTGFVPVCFKKGFYKSEGAIMMKKTLRGKGTKTDEKDN